MDEQFNKLWDNIRDYGFATEEEMQLVVYINGRTVETLNDIIFARTGYRNWDQVEYDLECRGFTYCDMK